VATALKLVVSQALIMGHLAEWSTTSCHSLHEHADGAFRFRGLAVLSTGSRRSGLASTVARPSRPITPAGPLLSCCQAGPSHSLALPDIVGGSLSFQQSEAALGKVCCLMVGRLLILESACASSSDPATGHIGEAVRHSTLW
jgi:hypothetical protein